MQIESHEYANKAKNVPILAQGLSTAVETKFNFLLQIDIEMHILTQKLFLFFSSYDE